MRDVTDNVTGDLLGVEQRRGRGRPRKAHAMTNAERQAAYRARHKMGEAADRSVTVTKMPVEVDAYDECRMQVDRLREELDEARREKEVAWRVMREKRDQAEELGREVLQLKKRLLQEKSVTAGNANSAGMVSHKAHMEVMLAAAQLRADNEFLEREVTRLCGELLLAKSAAKTVTRKRVTKSV